MILFGWLLWGDFSWQLKERSAMPVVQIMLRQFQASDFLTGLFMAALPAIIGVVIGPIISYRSDRRRGKWGRRIPYLILTTPIAAAGMFGLAFSPFIGAWIHDHVGGSPETLNLTVIVVMGLFWTAFEFATLSANVVFGALINDVVPREMIGRFFGMFRAVSLLTGIFFNYYLMGHVKEHYTVIFAAIGAVYGIGFFLMCLKVKEGDYPPPPVPAPGEPTGAWGAVRSYLKDCFTKPYYLWVIGSMAMAQLAFVPVNLYGVYAADGFGMSMGSYGKYLAATYACSLLLAFPLGWMADRFHATRMALAAMGLYSVVMAVAFFVVKGPTAFGISFLIHGVLSGCYLTGAAALGQMLFPKMKYAQFASAVAMALAAGNVLVGPLLGYALDKIGRDYRYIFAAGGVIGVSALIMSVVVYRRFVAYGGAKGYQAPE